MLNQQKIKIKINNKDKHHFKLKMHHGLMEMNMRMKINKKILHDK